METQFQETTEAEAQGLKSLTDDEPWENRQNLVSAVEENDTLDQEKARDKVTVETTNSRNHQAMAKGTAKLEKVKEEGEDHSCGEMGQGAQVGREAKQQMTAAFLEFDLKNEAAGEIEVAAEIGVEVEVELGFVLVLNL